MPRDGYGSTEDESVLCPLFRACTPHTIRCERHVPDSNTIEICYQNQQRCEKQKKIYCEGNWKRCEHYVSWLHMRWEDE